MRERRVVLVCGEHLTEQVASFTDSVIREAGLPSRQAYWLRLAAEEITTNVAHHGYRGRGGVVELVAGMDADRVWLRIEDDAPPFDPRTYDPAPRLAVEPARRQDGGYGLLLALRNLDDFGYDHVGGRNRNTLAMRRAPRTPVRPVEQPEREDS